MFLFLLSGVHGYAEISGSCNGVYGVHLPNEGVGDGGYRVVVSKEASPSTNTKSFFANVSIQHVSLIDTSSLTEIEAAIGSGSFQGFLLKSFDKETGEPLGTFMDPLPKWCTFYAGCSSPHSAISHIVDREQSEPNIYNGDGTVVFRFSWPSNAEVGFQLFVVETLTKWFEVRELSLGGAASVNGLPMDCRPQISPAAVAIGFAPVWILLGGALLYSPQHLHSARRTLSAVLNTPLAGLGKSGRSVRAVAAAAGAALRAVTFDAWGALAFADMGDRLAYLVFFSSQAASLYLSTDWVKGQPVRASLSRGIGRLLQINFSLALLLTTRNSPWSALLSVNFERCVVLHRAVGRSAFLLTLVHLALMWQDYGLPDLLSARPNCFGYGNVWGFISGWLCLAMLLGSLDVVRRRSYELFRATHALALPALLMSCLHATSTVYFLAVPLVLFVADYAVRAAQRLRPARVVEVKVLPGDVAELVIHAPEVAKRLEAGFEAGRLVLGSYIFLQCDALSTDPHDLHPFSVSSVRQECAGLGPAAAASAGAQAAGTFSIHIRGRGPGSWSTKLCERVRQGLPLGRIRVEGPHGGVDAARHHAGCHTFLVVAGGVGFTPMAPFISALLDPERRAAAASGLRRLVVVWAVQERAHAGWFAGLVERLLEHGREEARTGGDSEEDAQAFHAEIQIYVTRPARSPAPRAAPADLGEAPPACHPASSLDATESNATAATTTVFVAAADSVAAPSVRDDPVQDGCGVIPGRPDFGAIFRSVSPPSPPQQGAAGGVLPGNGTIVFTCGPAGMTREVQVQASAAGILVQKELFEF